MAVEESFQVDPDAAAAAKASGDYNQGEDGAKDSEPKDGEDDKPIISDDDPGKSDDPDAKSDDTDDDAKDDDKTDDKDKDKDKDKDDDTPEPSAEEKEFNTAAESWTQEFMEKGELSEETREAVVKQIFAPGVPKAQQEQYLATFEAGLKAMGEAATRSAFDIVGGQEAYESMKAWAASNLSEAEIAAFDADALGTDMGRRDTAIRGLHARAQQASGSEPDFEPNLAHDGGRGAGEPIIGSRQELARIQATEEYRTDPAVRAKVERQLRQSMATGKYKND